MSFLGMDNCLPCGMTGLGRLGVKYRGAGNDWICRPWRESGHPTSRGIPVERLCDPDQETLTAPPLKPIAPSGYAAGAGIARGTTPMQKYLQEQRRRQIVSRIPEASQAFRQEAQRREARGLPPPIRPPTAPSPRTTTVVPTGQRVIQAPGSTETTIRIEFPTFQQQAPQAPARPTHFEPERTPVVRDVVQWTPQAPADEAPPQAEAEAGEPGAFAWARQVPWWAWVVVGVVGYQLYQGSEDGR